MHIGLSNRDAFDAQVWRLVQQIPPGRVTTYGRLAAMLLPPEGVTVERYAAFGARWVGGAMARCPDGVPWQRVVNAQGKISVREGGSHERQRDLLEAEGVAFDDNGRVDWDRFGWNGPEDGET